MIVRIPSAFLLLGASLYFLFSCESNDPGLQPGPSPGTGPVTKLWEISDLSDTLVNVTGNQFTFLDESSMKATYVEVALGQELDLGQITFDNTYYAYAGTGMISIDGDERTLEAGGIVFSGAGSSVLFQNVSSTLKIVMVSMKTSSSENPPVEEFSKSTIEASRNPNRNIWNPFIQYPNLTIGMFMLPQANGGDNRIVHSWDELNIVTSGACQFQTDTGLINLMEGTIVFVGEGNGHYFTSLTSDTDILIYWEQP